MDTTELLLVIQMCLHQVWTGSEADATTMASLMETGQLTPPVEAVTDARSVFDSLAATDVGTLQEGSLVLHLLSLRDRLRVGTLSKAWWSDTRDMLADGLTKGSVSRQQLVECCDLGSYRVEHPTASTTCCNGRQTTTTHAAHNR